MADTTPVYVAPDLCAGELRMQEGLGCDADGKYQEQLASEVLAISGVPVNIFKLLGIHEQGKLQDLTGSGYPLTFPIPAPATLPPGTPPIPGSLDQAHTTREAFNTGGTMSWQSGATGPDVVNSAYIGYDFGTKRVGNPVDANGNPIGNAGVNKYGSTADPYAPDNSIISVAPIYVNVAMIGIQQGAISINRATQIKIEKSNDGVNWTRVDVITLLDTAVFKTYNVKVTAPAARWRITPTVFNGSTDVNAFWEVVKLQFIDLEETSLNTIQDWFFMENRDRDYSTTSIMITASYQPFDSMGDLSKFGFNLMEQYTFTCSFAAMVIALGRPIVIGDIIELPAETQYDHNLRPIKKFLEITDAGWSSEGYTTGWRPMLYRFQATQLIPAAENMDVITSANGMASTLNFATSEMTDSDFFSNVSNVDLSAQNASEHIKELASDVVPEAGVDSSTIQSGQSAHSLTSSDRFDYGIENGLPPNGLPYGEGFVLPTTNLVDGSYFRLDYPDATKIPSRLFKYSNIKMKWLYVETDRRQAYTSFKPSAQKILESTSRKSLGDI